MNLFFNLPDDIQNHIWFLVHQSIFKKIHKTFKKINTKFCIWTNPSDKLLNLVTYDIGCIQHPYNDFYNLRNKKYCGHCECHCAYFPNTCIDCSVIHIKNPWTDSSPFHNGLYKCGNCKYYGFPCANCATFFDGKIKPEIFYANF